MESPELNNSGCKSIPLPENYVLDFYFSRLITSGVASYIDIKNWRYSIHDLNRLHRYLNLQNYIQYQSNKQGKN